MRMATIIVVVLLVAVAVAFMTYRWFSGQVEEGGMGFMDYVRDPAGPERLQTELRQRDAAVGELAKEPPEVLVAMLLKDADQFGMPSRAIKAAGPRVVPALLAAVKDPGFRGGHQKGPFGDKVEPLQGVLSCLEEFAPAEAVPIVTPLIEDENEDIRKEVALLLGKIANDEAAAPITRLLSDEDDYVRSYAMMGIRRALDAKRVSDGFRRVVFDAVLPLAFRHAISGDDDAPHCLLGLDRERATALLTDSSRINAAQENLHNVLAALREADVVVDEKPLLNILSEMDGKETKYPAEYVVGETLMMLAMTNSAQARKALQKHLEHPSQRVREYAGQAHALASGLDDPWDYAWEKLRENAWQELSQPQRNVLAVRMLIDEVNNGGFLQYFVNSSGDYWRDAVRGLDAIGAKESKRHFDRALDLFGSESPSEDRGSRHEQVAAIADKKDRPFEEIESEFYHDKDDREVLLLQYMLKNVGEFRRESDASP